MKNFFKSSTFVSISTIITFLMAFYISYMENLIGEKNLAIAVTFTIFISILAVVLYSSYSHSKIEENFISKIKIIEDFIKSNGMGDIINELTLSIWESSANSIWVITNDLANDIGISNDKVIERKIIETVQENLKRGKKYIYFVPNTKLIIGRLYEYKKLHSKFYDNSQVKICLIPYEAFHFINEIVLYDIESGENPRAVQWFPNRELNYYIVIDAHTRDNIVGVLQFLKNKYGLKTIEDIVE